MNTRGGIAMAFGVSLPVVLAVLGLASDYAMMVRIRTQLQAAADSAALAGAREIPLANSNPEQVKSAAATYAAYQLTNKSSANDEDLASFDLTISSEVIEDFTTVRVAIRESWRPFFAHFIAGGVTPIDVSATARFVGQSNICVLGLSPSTVAGVQLWDSAYLKANGCAVFSNTAGAKGFVVDSGATLISEMNCVTGGASYMSAKSVEPTPITDCPPLHDPLESRPPPSVGGCDHTKLSIKKGEHNLEPGVYCGGLTISGTAKVTMAGGTYVIKDGPLLVLDTASLDANNAGFYLTGFLSTVYFAMGTSVSLSAPESGDMAGLLFFEDRAASGLRIHRIGSNDARKLLGTIYMSKSILNIDASAPVADQSAYTAIVTQSLQLQSGPNLVLNSDYAATSVPVPAGIAGSSQVYLSD